MCGRRLKIFLVSLVLSFLFVFSQSLSLCYADVNLTDQEAMEILTEIQESKKDLMSLQTQLEDVKKDYNEQKIYYEEQLKEVNKEKAEAQMMTITSTSIAVVMTFVVIFLLI